MKREKARARGLVQVQPFDGEETPPRSTYVRYAVSHHLVFITGAIFMHSVGGGGTFRSSHSIHLYVFFLFLFLCAIACHLTFSSFAGGRLRTFVKSGRGGREAAATALMMYKNPLLCGAEALTSSRSAELSEVDLLRVRDRETKSAIRQNSERNSTTETYFFFVW